MALCVYKFVFNKHVKYMVVVGAGGSGAHTSVYYRGATCIGEGSGNAYGPSGSRAAPKGGGARTPEASWN